MDSPNQPADQRRTPLPEIVTPSLLLIAFGLTVWLSVFIAGAEENGQTAPYLRSRGEGQIDGVTAAMRATEEARNAVESARPGHAGLLAGPLERVRVRYEPLRTASIWTVLLEGPIRSRPNTPEEFRILEGMIVVEISAFTGEISGHFAGGRVFGSPNSAAANSLLRQLGISGAGFVDVPVRLVYNHSAS